MLKKEGRGIEAINYIFCTDAYLLELNKTHLKHNTYTDIITFELSGKSEAIVADIYISVERVRENANSYQTSFIDELYRVIFHGSLPLAGYKDKSKADSVLMRQM
jgi:rRNA maturation RNase YbeY